MNSKAQKIEQTAADWMTRRLSDRWTEADQAEFDVWIADETTHRIAYVRLDAAWNQAGRLKALTAGVAQAAIPTLEALAETRFPYRAIAGHEAAARAPQKRSFAWQVALAAALALAIGLGFYFAASGTLFSNSYVTEVGDTDTVTLADGSRVTLNTDTRLRVSLESQERRIELERGEAFFDVARDPSRPFVVAVGAQRVVAVGTQFSVHKERDAVRVVVAEGRVLVGGEALIEAGSVAETKAAHVTVHRNAASQVEQLLSWRQGMISFHATPLTDAVAEFNRYSARKIVIQDASIADIRVGGSFRSTNAEAFLWMLQKGFGISAERTGDEVFLKGP